MREPVLSDEEVERFVEDGWVLLPNAFDRGVAEQVCDAIWDKMEVDRQDPETWTQEVIHLQELLNGPPFDKVLTERVSAAYDQLMGPGRWKPHDYLGWWPVAFPGFAEPPWIPPTENWHADGNWFQHHVDSKEQGLLTIFLMTDIDPGGGGTTIAPGMHKDVARLLRDSEPEGMTPDEIRIAVAKLCDAVSDKPVVEITGKAGDLAVMHPLIPHARSLNTGDRVRIICNPPYSFLEPMNLDREDPADYSPVERAIVEALDS